MNNWIFVASSHESDGRTFTPDEIFRRRMEDKFWGLGEKTPNRKNLQQGDQVVFYLGNPRKHFVGSARLATASFPLSPKEQEDFAHGTEFFRASYGVRLNEISIWDPPKPVIELLGGLSFIQNKQHWGTYLQGGVRGLSEADFSAILQGNSSPSVCSTPDELEKQTEFALETHLEEFLDRNWDSIDFGAKLERYKEGDQDGRQFPAGRWYIDFLCTDKLTGDFVVVELKRGQTGDSTIGQVLRYMQYIKEKVARPDQSVRGIIIAKDIDEALMYAVRGLPNVSVLTYQIDFTLSVAKK